MDEAPWISVAPEGRDDLIVHIKNAEVDRVYNRRRNLQVERDEIEWKGVILRSEDSEVFVRRNSTMSF